MIFKSCDFDNGRRCAKKTLFQDHLGIRRMPSKLELICTKIVSG
jgi:hypothetical protein